MAQYELPLVINVLLVIFQVFTVASMKTAVTGCGWDVAPCN
jgi:hypothetical protein